MITFRQRDLEGAGYVGWLLDEGIGLLGFIFTTLSYVNNLPEVGGAAEITRRNLAPSDNGAYLRGCQKEP